MRKIIAIIVITVGFVHAEGLEKSRSGSALIPMGATEPFTIYFDSKKSSEEMYLENLKFNPVCHLRVVNLENGLHFGLFSNEDLIFTSKLLSPILNEIDRAHDSELCFNDDIAPRCMIEEKRTEDIRKYKVSIGKEALVSTQNMSSAIKIVKKLTQLRLCNYGSKFHLALKCPDPFE